MADRLTPSDDIIVADFRSGMTCPELADRYGVSSWAMRHVLIRLGLVIKTQRHAKTMPTTPRPDRIEILRHVAVEKTGGMRIARITLPYNSMHVAQMKENRCEQR